MPTLTAKENGKYKTDGFDRLVVNVSPGGGGASVAVDVSYDPSRSGLSATNVQSAIDEVQGNIPDPSNTTPLMDGAAEVGAESKFARGDHRHPSDSTKVDKVSGKGLSTNDFTTAEKNKLSGIQEGAEANVQADWSEVDSASDAFIQNKPTIPTSTSDLTNDSGFVTSAELPDASDATPLMDGTASAGSEEKWARGDHVHPHDTSKVNVAGDTMTGTLFIDAPTNSAIKVRNHSVSSDIGADIPSGSNVYPSGFYQLDPDNYQTWYSELAKTPADMLYKSFVLRRRSADHATTYYHGMYWYINNEGVPSVGFSNNTSRDAFATGANVVKRAGDSMTGRLQAIDVASVGSGYIEVYSAVTKAEVTAKDSSLTSSSSVAAWQTALLKAICTKYPNRTNTVFKGALSPSSHAFYEVFIYNTSTLSNGLPQYSFGLWRQYSTQFKKFGTESYTFYSNDVDTNTTYSAATTSAQGLMTAADKTKLNGIATGATKNSLAFTSYTVSKTYSISANAGASGSVSGTIPSGYKAVSLIAFNTGIPQCYFATIGLNTDTGAVDYYIRNATGTAYNNQKMTYTVGCIKI